MRQVLITLLVVFLVIGVAAFTFLKTPAGGFSARAEPSAIEAMAARWARRVAVPNDVFQNGVRFTGMRGWGSGSEHDAQDSWKLVRFIRHLPKLSAEEEQDMEKMNPKTPDELKEEQEERDSLSGGEVHEHVQHEHH